jgi:hypothetical protein
MIDYNDDNRFDLALQKGRMHERALGRMLEGTFYESKAEIDVWKTTGKAFIECWSRGKPSGLAVTEADTWVQAFEVEGGETVYIMLSTERLRALCAAYGKLKEGVGDDKAQKGFLLTLWDFFKPV